MTHPDDEILEAAPAQPPQPAPKKTSSFRRWFLRLTGLVLLLVIAGATWLGYEAWYFLNTPAQAEGRDIVVNIEPGASLASIARTLEEQGAISDARRFIIMARFQKKEQSIQAGRFLVRTSWLPPEVLERLVSGQAMLHRVTLPEGKTWWEVAAILEQNEMCLAADFTTVIFDPEFLQHWGIPFTSAEGFLYPDTYLMLQPKEMDLRSARSAANRVVETFWKRTEAFWPEGRRPDAATLKQVLTLASIVEKETGVGSERATVAGVYANRLKKKMLLQADPTVIYGLGSAFSGPLLRSHLENQENPYNTYRRQGLPPGPICSPGAAAIKAALEPEKHDFLYFVATGRDRSHVFSKTLQEHNRAVQRYRQALREQGLR